MMTIHRTQTNRRFLLIFVPLFLLVTVFGASAQIIDMPLATVDLTGTDVLTQRTITESVNILERTVGRELTADEKNQVLQSEINALLVNQAAEAAGISVTAQEVDAAIEQQRLQVGAQISDQRFRQEIQNQTGLNWNQYRAQVREQLVHNRYVLQEKGAQIQGVDQPTQQEIRSVYEENATSFSNPAMIRFDHIFFDTRQAGASETRDARNKAEQLNRRLESGSVTFDGLVRESLDDPSYAGGDFGYLVRGDQARRQLLGSEFFEEMFSLEDGEVSGVHESNLGFHIVRVTDKRSARLLGLDDPILPGNTMTVRDQIRQYILSQRQQVAQQEAIAELVSELRDRAEITVYEDNLPW